MRPPACDVCDAEPDEEAEAGGALSGFALVTCVPTAESVAWRERAEREHFTGHPPDVGWFCAEHADAARQLAAGAPLAAVVAAIRADERSATCEPSDDIGALYVALRALLPEVAASVGIDPGRLAATEEQRWTPMDGATPPDCPWVDTLVHTAAEVGQTLELSFEVAWWNPAGAARSSLSLSLHGAGERNFTVSAWSPASGDPHGIEEVRAKGAVPASVHAVLDEWSAPPA